MTASLLATLVINEARIRLRRANTSIVMALSALLMWFAVVDWSSGYSMLAAHSRRIAYDSAGLGLGGSSIATLLIGLFGFYLLRGRCDDDVRLDLASLIASTGVSNRVLLLTRWAAGVLYLTLITLILVLTMAALQHTRGEGDVRPLVLLHFYLLAVVPNIFWVAALAVLWDAWPPLMGKGGDCLYFLLWLVQLAAATAIAQHLDGTTPWLVFDLGGTVVMSHHAQELLGTNRWAVGLNSFDSTAAPLHLGDGFWTWSITFSRIASLFLSFAPLALAIRLFHRYSPDRLSRRRVRGVWQLPARLTALLRAVDVAPRTLLSCTCRLPRPASTLGADLALTLAARPLAGYALAAIVSTGVLIDTAVLPPLTLVVLTVWALLVADVSVRDYAANLDEMSTAAAGGGAQRYWRHFGMTLLLGCALSAPIIARWGVDEPARAATLAAALLILSALAQLLGSVTRTGRAFLVLFMTVLYGSTQVAEVAAFDIFGVHAIATGGTAARQLGVGLGLLALGLAVARWRAR